MVASQWQPPAPSYQPAAQQSLLVDPFRLCILLVTLTESVSPGRHRGQGLAEYALMLALIAIIAIVALIFLGSQTSAILHKVGTSI